MVDYKKYLQRNKLSVEHIEIVCPNPHYFKHAKIVCELVGLMNQRIVIRVLNVL